jgi:hypothetical protein
MGFRFDVKQRVNVPGTNGAQGVITDRIESLPGFPVYTFHWVRPDGALSISSCGGNDLAAANPTNAEILALAFERDQENVRVEIRARELAKEMTKPKARLFRGKRKR